jgi:hypothetical protein
MRISDKQDGIFLTRSDIIARSGSVTFLVLRLGARETLVTLVVVASDVGGIVVHLVHTFGLLCTRSVLLKLQAYELKTTYVLGDDFFLRGGDVLVSAGGGRGDLLISVGDWRDLDLRGTGIVLRSMISMIVTRVQTCR